MRDDVDPWVRHGEHPNGATGDLVRSVECLDLRSGREWTDADERLMAELDRRAWGFGELQRQRCWSLPSWVTPELVPRRRMGGYQRFLALLIRAFRGGAAGVLCSYEEAMAVCDVSSRSTWRGWTREMTDRGLVRVVQTWVRDPETGRRRFGRLLYRIGPALEGAAGYGIVEGVAPDGPRAEWAERAARGARARARRERKERKAELWRQHHGESRPAQTAESEPPPRAPTPSTAVQFPNPTQPLREQSGSSGARGAARPKASPSLARPSLPGDRATGPQRPQPSPQPSTPPDDGRPGAGSKRHATGPAPGPVPELADVVARARAALQRAKGPQQLPHPPPPASEQGDDGGP